MCDFTAKRNKDPDQATLATLMETVTEATPFVDSAFPADETSLLWAEVGETWSTAGEVEVWKRIKDVYGGGDYSLFGSNGVTPRDIFQGSIGNCWFMSALSAIAEKPGRVEKLFLNPTNEIEPLGIYGIQMKALGVNHTVLIDDFLPGYMNWNDEFRPLFAGVQGDNSVWGAVIEKAFAKFHGNYKHTVGGWPHRAVWDLLGGPYEEYDHLEEAGGRVITSVDDLWAKL